MASVRIHASPSAVLWHSIKHRGEGKEERGGGAVCVWIAFLALDGPRGPLLQFHLCSTAEISWAGTSCFKRLFLF